jgi:hypothetical protein
LNRSCRRFLAAVFYHRFRTDAGAEITQLPVLAPTALAGRLAGTDLSSAPGLQSVSPHQWQGTMKPQECRAPEIRTPPVNLFD